MPNKEFQTSGFIPKNTTGFFLKTLAQNERGFEWHFLESLISALQVELTGVGKIIRHNLRPGSKSKLTARSSTLDGTHKAEIIDRDQRTFEQVTNGSSTLSQYSSTIKRNFCGTKIQAISFYDGSNNESVFISREDKATIGITHLDVLPNRFFLSDAGTVNRPYDSMLYEDLYQGNKIPIADWDSFLKQIRSQTEQNDYNEILARIKWHIGKSKISVHNNTPNSLVAAIAFQEKMQQEFKDLAKNIQNEDLKQMLLEPIELVHHYKINGQLITTPVIAEEKKTAIDWANKINVSLFGNSVVNLKEHFEKNGYESLFQLNTEQLSLLFSEKNDLFNDILVNRPYIAEYLIIKYHNLCLQDKNSCVITFPKDYAYDITKFSKNFTSKIITGEIAGFNLVNNKISVAKTITGLDLSDMDLSKFDFSGVKFLGVSLNGASLPENITKCSFENCDLRIKNYKEVNLFKNNEFDQKTNRTDRLSNVINQDQLELLLQSQNIDQDSKQLISGFNLMYCNLEFVRQHKDSFDQTPKKNVFPSDIVTVQSSKGFPSDKQENILVAAIKDKNFELAKKFIFERANEGILLSKIAIPVSTKSNFFSFLLCNSARRKNSYRMKEVNLEQLAKLYKAPSSFINLLKKQTKAVKKAVKKEEISKKFKKI